MRRMFPAIDAAFGACSAARRSEPAEGANVAILTDDLRRSARGSFGHPFLKTPNIDRRPVRDPGLHASIPKPVLAALWNGGMQVQRCSRARFVQHLHKIVQILLNVFMGDR